MTYKHLEPKRRAFIDDVVLQVRGEYESAEGIDWEKIAEDYNVHLLRDNRFVQPIIYQDNDWDLSIIGIPARDNPDNRFSLAHEFGHHLLGHRKLPKRYRGFEDEADYFAERMVGKLALIDMVIGRVIDVITHPIAAFKCEYGGWEAYSNQIIREFIPNFPDEIPNRDYARVPFLGPRVSVPVHRGVTI